jgi:Domain of unknown function (DUF4956)
MLMPDWLRVTPAGAPDSSPSALAWRIGVALVLGVAVAALYRWAKRGERVPATFSTTLVLLAVLIAMATQIIGDNVARAFSLVGALSVVRFRTVVQDTQDIAFVIFAVVVGMASGANHLAVGLVGLAVIGIAALVLWPPRRGGHWQRFDSTLVLRVGLGDAIRASVEQALSASSAALDLVEVSTARQGTLLDLTFRLRLRAEVPPDRLVTDLNQIEGVESVDLKRKD